MPFDRIRLFGLIALLMARVTLSSHDPGRLLLIGSSGGLIINFLTLLFWVVCVARDKQLYWGTLAQRLFCVGLLGLVGVTILSAQMQDCYKRPSFFIAAEFLSLAAFAHLLIQACREVRSIRMVLSVLIACSVMQGSEAILQEGRFLFHLKDTSNRVGQIESHPQIEEPMAAENYGFKETKFGFYGVTGTLPDPRVFLVVCLLTTFPLIVIVVQGIRRRGVGSLVVVSALILILGMFFAQEEIYTWQVDRYSPAEAIGKAPLFGIGPGCWSRHNPPTQGSPLQDFMPYSFVFGILATSGLLALIPFAVIVFALVKGVLTPVTQTEESPQNRGRSGEIYLGAMFGLTWGFVWMMSEFLPNDDPETPWDVGAHAVVRALVWYASYAVLERITLSLRQLRIALDATVIIGLLMGIASSAFFYAQASWLFVAYVCLALALRSLPSSSLPGRTRRGIFVLVGLVLLGLEFLLVTRPGVNTLQTFQEARATYSELQALEDKVNKALGEGTRKEAQKRLARFIGENISQPLREAARIDHRNATLRRELVKWDRWEWYHVRHSDPAKALKLTEEVASVMRRVEYLDPKHPANPETEFAALIVFIGGSTTDIEKRIESAHRCIDAIKSIKPQSEVGNRYKLADALLVPSHRLYAIIEIKKINELVEIEGQPHGHLTQEQRQSMQKKLADLVNPKVPKEK